MYLNIWTKSKSELDVKLSHSRSRAGVGFESDYRTFSEILSDPTSTGVGLYYWTQSQFFPHIRIKFFPRVKSN